MVTCQGTTYASPHDLLSPLERSLAGLGQTRSPAPGGASGFAGYPGATALQTGNKATAMDVADRLFRMGVDPNHELTRMRPNGNGRGRFEDYMMRGGTTALMVAALSFDEVAVKALLAHGAEVDEPNDFEIYSNDSLASAFRSIAATVRIGAFIVSAIALVSAGVGIMNIMLVSVTERTKEIGIRKSLGARQRDIRMQFLLEALFLSLLGATAGILLGVLAGNGLALWLQAAVVFPFDWAIIGVLVCSLIGVGFGLYPAHKAASLDPIEALRYE